MGSTIWHVPRARTHEKALSIYANSKPIRGTDDRRPLGARRNHIKYSVRKHGDDVQFVLYKTPVITYHPDDTITVKTDGWNSMATHEMISWVLDIGARGWRGNTCLTIGDSVYTLKGSDASVKLIPTAQGGLCFESQQERLGYRMNRKAANNVRRRYAPFLNYLNGMLKLREQEVETTKWYVSGQRATTATKVVISREELEQVRDFYLSNVTDGFVNTKHGATHDKTVRAQQQLMLELINPDQPEDTRHENFYKAALSLARGYSGVTNTGGGSILRDTQDVLDRTDEALLMAHAEEVLEVTKLEGKAMPNPKYMNWIFRQPEDKSV